MSDLPKLLEAICEKCSSEGFILFLLNWVALPQWLIPKWVVPDSERYQFTEPPTYIVTLSPRIVLKESFSLQFDEKSAKYIFSNAKLDTAIKYKAIRAIGKIDASERDQFESASVEDFAKLEEHIMIYQYFFYPINAYY